MKIILQKIIAASGYCSRREAERLIRNGSVKVNGQTAEVGQQADPKKDRITVKGELIGQAEKPIYLVFNKPVGYTCTNRNFPGERNIFELIRRPERLFAVGRLDKDSRGLVLLTNDGDLTLKLSHPRFAHEKVYEVQVKDEVINPKLVIKELLKGINIEDEDEPLKAEKAEYLQNDLFIITLNEGKKRQIRRMFEALGTKVADLKRVRLGSLSLGSLPEGKYRELTSEELAKLKREIR